MDTDVEESQYITSPILNAAHRVIGLHCNDVNDAFILCKEKDPDPAACLDIGFEVSKCVNKTIKTVSSVCEKELKNLAECLEDHTFKWVWCSSNSPDYTDYETPFYECLSRNGISWLK